MRPYDEHSSDRNFVCIMGIHGVGREWQRGPLRVHLTRIIVIGLLSVLIVSVWRFAAASQSSLATLKEHFLCWHLLSPCVLVSGINASLAWNPGSEEFCSYTKCQLATASAPWYFIIAPSLGSWLVWCVKFFASWLLNWAHRKEISTGHMVVSKLSLWFFKKKSSGAFYDEPRL